MNKSIFLMAVASVSLVGQAAVPVVSNVEFTQNRSTREVTVRYKLSSVPAIVTVDFETNYVENAETKWASIGAENIRNVTGDAFVEIAAAKETYSISWRPDVSWPGEKLPVGSIRAVVTAHDLCDAPDYMTVMLSASATPQVRYFTCAEAVPGGVTNSEYKLSSLLMRRIHAKNVIFPMGSVAEDGVDAPLHPAKLDDDYYVAVYPITQSQWNAVKGSNPSYFQKTDWPMRPVETVSYARIRMASSDSANVAYDWPNAPHPDSFLGKLNTMTGDHLAFDLPCEAQWEYAARAGNWSGFLGRSDVPFSGNGASLNKIGRWGNNGGKPGGNEPANNVDATKGSAIVGSYLPNDWGIYDTLGNVGEWCADWYESSEAIAGIAADGEPYYGRPNAKVGGKTLSDAAGEKKVIRGGALGWCAWAVANMCPAYRGIAKTPNSTERYYGFRVICRGPAVGE